MPGQGRSHLPLSTEELSLCTTATEPVLWSPATKPTCPKARAPQERPAQWETLTAQLESGRRSQLEKSPHNNNDVAQPKNPTKIIKRPSCSLDDMIGGYLSHSGKLTFSSTGLIKTAGPSMNWWSISHVVRSSVNLKGKMWKVCLYCYDGCRGLFPRHPRLVTWGSQLYSLMEKGSDHSAALSVSLMHQSIEVRQQSISGLEDFSWEHLKGWVPGHRILSLKG